MKRIIDHYLGEWKQRPDRKALLLRGARQVGKTYAVRELGKKFDELVEINLELNPETPPGTGTVPSRLLIFTLLLYCTTSTTTLSKESVSKFKMPSIGWSQPK